MNQSAVRRELFHHYLAWKVAKFTQFYSFLLHSKNTAGIIVFVMTFYAYFGTGLGFLIFDYRVIK